MRLEPFMSVSVAGRTNKEGEADAGAGLLEIRGLRVEFPGLGTPPVIDGIDLDVGRGEIVALVGESGSGKSLTALSLMGLLPPTAEVTDGIARLGGADLLTMPESEMTSVRGGRIGMLFQQPKAMLDPTMKVGLQVSEAIRRHRGKSRAEARAVAVDLLRSVGIPDPQRRADGYAHQMSGGMAQRVMIAAALSADPELLIADEPTTALDVTVQAQILDLLRRKRDELGLSILLITHDLGVVASMADRVAVMYAGRIVETAQAGQLFNDPRHPYSKALLKASLLEDARGKLFSIPGSAAQSRLLTHGCRFRPRCSVAAQLGIAEACESEEPQMHECSDDQHHSRCHAELAGGGES
jgi:peptide/nickel transport system ATP-binding protein